MIRIQNTVSVDCVLLLHYNAKKKKLSLTVESEEGGRERSARELGLRQVGSYCEALVGLECAVLCLSFPSSGVQVFTLTTGLMPPWNTACILDLLLLS